MMYVPGGGHFVDLLLDYYLLFIPKVKNGGIILNSFVGCLSRFVVIRAV